MKIALIKPSATYADWYKRPVMGLSYLAAYLAPLGFECKIFDAYFNSWSETELRDQVIAFRPDVVGISSMTHEIKRAAHLAGLIKRELKVPTVVGGCHVTALPERTLAEFPEFDFGVSGEGEKTAVELFTGLRDGNREGWSSILGLAWRGHSKIFVNPPRSWLTADELNAMPFPAFHQYYGQHRAALAGPDAYYVMFSGRGCPYHCAFCMQVLGRQVRRRSAENIVAEIEFAIERYGAHTFNFADEIFLFDNKQSRQVLQLMIDKGLPEKIRWRGGTRANMVTPEIIALAKQSGCYQLEMGVESGDDEVLARIGKQITVAQVREAVKTIKAAGIGVCACFILGHPHETRETIKRTIDLSAELNPDAIAVGIMVPYPGTQICEMAHKGEGGYRLLSEDWAQYDKYGGKALEVEGLPWEELARWQRRAILNLYLKNFRVRDFFKYFWERRRSLYFFGGKWLSAKLGRNQAAAG